MINIPINVSSREHMSVVSLSAEDNVAVMLSWYIFVQHVLECWLMHSSSSVTFILRPCLPVLWIITNISTQYCWYHDKTFRNDIDIHDIHHEWDTFLLGYDFYFMFGGVFSSVLESESRKSWNINGKCQILMSVPQNYRARLFFFHFLFLFVCFISKCFIYISRRLLCYHELLSRNVGGKLVQVQDVIMKKCNEHQHH